MLFKLVISNRKYTKIIKNYVMKGYLTTGMLILSNIFMTLAWYGHLKFKELKWFENVGLITIVLISWGLALFEYAFQVPANRIEQKNFGFI